MYSIQQIIENQKEFNDEIISFFNKEKNDANKILNTIVTKDKYITKEKNKLKNRFKKIKIENHIKKLFFSHPSRNLVFYVWWDKEIDEAKILKYDQR